MDRINGIVTLNINYYIDLDDPMYDGCETMKDVLKILKQNINYPLEDLADKREIQKILYEGFDVEVDLDEWNDERNEWQRIYG